MTGGIPFAVRHHIIIMRGSGCGRGYVVDKMSSCYLLRPGLEAWMTGGTAGAVRHHTTAMKGSACRREWG